MESMEFHGIRLDFQYEFNTCPLNMQHDSKIPLERIPKVLN